MLTGHDASFGERLRRYRERSGLTQEALAERAGLTANAVGALERGLRRRPYPHTVRALADALDLAGDERTALFASGAGRADTPSAPVASQPAPAPSELPPQLTTLVGRTGEATAVEQLLRRGDVRLLTLIGPGGVGKTRLAIEVVGACAEQFADGVAFVPLAPLDRSDLVVPTIARTLGLQEAGGAPPLQALTRWLRDRRFLLLLDNFEHLMAAAVDIAELLLSCAQLKVLVTSREALRLRGEQEYPVPPLAFPRDATDTAAAAMLEYDAVRLFVQRAQAVRPDFALTEANAQQIAQICARLDGLPLAIELAAARTAMLTPQALLVRLEHQLQVLTGGARDLPERQRTMRATIAWSYDLLAPAEQRLYRRLAIFADGAALDAIEAICPPDAPGDDITELMSSLVHKHLVQRAEHGPDEPRFEMLETIRVYGLEQLRSSGELDQIVAAHAGYFLALAESAAPHLMRQDQSRWFRGLTREINNLRTAVGSLLARGAWAEAVRLVWALWRFWWVRGLHREARQWMKAVLEQAGPDTLTPLHLAQAELTVGSMAWAAGDLREAERLCAQSLARAPQHGHARTEAIARMMLGAAEVSSGAEASAGEQLAGSIALFQEIGELWGAAFGMSYQGLDLLKRGMVDAALATCSDALAIARRSGDLTITHQALYVMGMATQIQGAHDRAAQAFAEGLALCRELEDRVNVGYFIKGIAELAALYLDAARAARLLGAAQALMDAIGVPFHRDAPGQAWHTQLLAQVRASLGDAAFNRMWAEGRALSVQQTYHEAHELGDMLLERLAAGAEVQPGGQLATGAHADEPPARGKLTFARTKIQPPRPRTDLLMRARLVERIRAQLAGIRLILVSAPVGAGKTTLLATAAAALGYPYAWLTLDADDNDLARFLTVLCAALDQLAPGVERAVAPMLNARRPDLPPLAERANQVIDTAVNTLIDALPFGAGATVSPAPCLLVIDDLHMVTEPVVHATLAYLIDHLPTHMTLALTTRHEPPLNLARLRARRELIDLRLPDLRFTRAETVSLLNERLALDLDPNAIAALHARTEGWAAGLSMLAASLETIATPGERASFVTHLTGTDRHLFDYLAEEVLNRQDPFTRAFLLETSILAELTPRACRSLSGRTDAAQVLDDLYRRNLFLVKLDDRPLTSDQQLSARGADAGGPLVEIATYRYHDLFRTFLRERLRRETPEWWRQLHRRAAAAAGDPAQAIEHYLLAERWDAAAEAIERVGADTMAGGAFERLRGWIDALPAATQDAHPRLLLWLGICHWQQLAVDAARAALARAHDGFAFAGDPLGQGEALAWLAQNQSLYGDFATAQATVAGALALPLPARLRVRMLAARALGLLLNGHWQKANDALDEAISLAEATPEPQVIDNLVDDLQAPLSTVPGGTARFERVLRLADAHRPGPPSLYARALRALVAAWRGRWDEAMDEGRTIARLVAGDGAAAWQALNCAGLLTIIGAMRGAPEDDPALRLLTGGDVTFDTTFARSVAVYFHFHTARAALLRGERPEAHRIYGHLLDLTRDQQAPFVSAIVPLLEGLIALEEGRFAEAERPLGQAVALQDRLRVPIIAADARVLLAAARLAAGQPDEALALFAPRLVECAGDDTPGLLMWQGPLVVPLLRLAIDRGIEAPFAARTLEII